MLLREHHHPIRVAQFVSVFARFPEFADRRGKMITQPCRVRMGGVPRRF